MSHSLFSSLPVSSAICNITSLAFSSALLHYFLVLFCFHLFVFYYIPALVLLLSSIFLTISLFFSPQDYHSLPLYHNFAPLLQKVQAPYWISGTKSCQTSLCPTETQSFFTLFPSGSCLCLLCYSFITNGCLTHTLCIAAENLTLSGRRWRNTS